MRLRFQQLRLDFGLSYCICYHYIATDALAVWSTIHLRWCHLSSFLSHKYIISALSELQNFKITCA